MRLQWVTGKIAVFLCSCLLFMLMTRHFTVDPISQLTSQLEALHKRYVGNPPIVYTPPPGSNILLKHQDTCQPYSKVAFAKTHKTGSSTLQNIFFRYGSHNGLTFAIPEKSWMYSFKEPFNASVITDLPWAKLGFDLFIFHSIWNYNEVQKVLPSAVYITLLRDPVDCYESNYVYMGLQKSYKMDINEFARKKAAMNIPRRSNAIIGKNQMLWDLGMGWKEMENKTLVQDKVERMDKQFHFVLLAEFFDESLVILARILCWNLEDVRSLVQNARKNENKSNISEEARVVLKDWLWADYMLYDNFKKRYEEMADRYGRQDLDKDVARLRKLNQDLKTDCVMEVADNSKLKGEFRMALDIVQGYVIDTTKPWCSEYARSEPNFSTQVRKQQLLRSKETKV